MKNKPTILLTALFVLLMLLSCEDIGNKRSNPLDPNGINYQSPHATIDYPESGYRSESNEVDFVWHGNNPHCLYSYKLAYSDSFYNSFWSGWSDWVSLQDITIGSLDEEAYTFGVKARYPRGEEQIDPTMVDFSVDASPDSSLLIKPCSTAVSLEQEFTIQIWVKEVENLMAAKINLTFSSYFLEVVEYGIDEGELLREIRENGGGVVFLYSKNNSSGKIEIDLGIVEGTAAGVSGTGTLAVITFKAKKRGLASISFDSYDLRDTNNYSIQINGSRGGKVRIE
jgi:hypothetical protein